MQPVQLWDGKKFSYVDEKTAKELVKAGTHQRTKGVDANKLHPLGYFTAALERAKTRDQEPKKHKYKTTEMRAE
jgi:hypothetical protein